MRGLALSNSDVIRVVHNSFARYTRDVANNKANGNRRSMLTNGNLVRRQTLFEYDANQPSKDEDVFHFVSFIPIDGRLYELDGLKDGPIDLGPCPPGDEWVQAAKPIIQKRINR